MVTVDGPPLDQLVSPAPELVDETHPPAYTSMTYKEFYELQQSTKFDKETALDQIRIPS